MSGKFVYEFANNRRNHEYSVKYRLKIFKNFVTLPVAKSFFFFFFCTRFAEKTIEKTRIYSSGFERLRCKRFLNRKRKNDTASGGEFSSRARFSIRRIRFISPLSTALFSRKTRKDFS